MRKINFNIIKLLTLHELQRKPDTTELLRIDVMLIRLLRETNNETKVF